jgi:hypothetical protein
MAIGKPLRRMHVRGSVGWGGRSVRAALFLFVWAWGWPASAESEFGVLHRAREIRVSPELQKLTPSLIRRAESVDFTGDGVPDFVLSVEPDVDLPGKTYDTRELWITSDGNLLRSTLLFRTPIWERWFVNLDRDPEPELLTVSGYEDGVDFEIADQTEELRAQEGLFRLLPVFRVEGSEGSPHALGLPGNLDGAWVAGSSSTWRLSCSFDFAEEFLIDAGVAGMPNPPQRLLPIVFFESPTVAGESRHPIHTSAELSLEEITQRSRARVADVIVREPTLVALLPQRDGGEVADPDDVDVEADFRWHLAGVHHPLTLAGISVSERRAADLIVRNGDQVDVFVPDASRGGIGYYLVSPGRAPRILHGVHTDVDLLIEAARYFCVLPQWLPDDEADPSSKCR